MQGRQFRLLSIALQGFGSCRRPPMDVTAEGCGERRQAGAPQSHVGLAGLAGDALDDRDGVVADAVDRKEHQVGARDLCSEQAAAVVDASVTMQEGCPTLSASMRSCAT